MHHDAVNARQEREGRDDCDGHRQKPVRDPPSVGDEEGMRCIPCDRGRGEDGEHGEVIPPASGITPAVWTEARKVWPEG